MTESLMSTPWGEAWYAKEIAAGVWWVATHSHGGLRLSPERWASLPAGVWAAMGSPGFAEEDCEAPIVRTLLRLAGREEREAAVDTARRFACYAPALPYLERCTEHDTRRNAMTTTIERKRADVYARPAARFDDDGNPVSGTGQVLEVRASAVGNCRRALWYAATGHAVTDPPSPETLTTLEAGNALEPVVLGAMERAGWRITPADPLAPQPVSVRIGPALTVTGHPDAVGVMPLFDGETVIEVKTRNPEAFKRWKALGAERSHPSAVAQAALYTLGLYKKMRDAVIACMDTGSREWDYEVIPARRMERALDNAYNRLSALEEHYALHGPDPAALPERDFAAGSWQCRSCPYLTACQPGMAEAESVEEPSAAGDAGAEEPVSDEAARLALHDYEELQDTLREFEDEKRWRLETLREWLRQKGAAKARLEGRHKTRTVGMVSSRRYAVDYRKLNALLDPETRAGIVTEQVSEYLRVS